MRFNRKFLYLGVFLVAIGGVLVAADLTAAEATAIREALRLWPLAIVAIGLGIASRRTTFSLPAGLLAAALPGLVLGGGFALAPGIVADCGAPGAASNVATEQGTFDGPAEVSVATGCGSLVVITEPGNAWRFESHDAGGPAPIVNGSSGSLSIDAGRQRWWSRFDDDRDTWRLTLPTTPIENLSVVVNAGEGQLSLPNARLGRLEVTTNAGRTMVDLSEATVTNIVGEVNAGEISYRLPAADVAAMFEVNAGGLELCVPDEVGLRVSQEGNLSGISIGGQHQTGTHWESPNYASATHQAGINLEVNLGNVEINPIGGCK